MRFIPHVVAAAAATLCMSAYADNWVFVGSWTVDEGPRWEGVPEAYTGQEAAALLFGGDVSDYAISTVDSLASNIDFQAWVSTWGGACGGTFPCGTKVAENFETSTGGLYAWVGDTSAYVSDWAIGAEYRNYAFRLVPEPETYALMLMGLAALGGVARRRS